MKQLSTYEKIDNKYTKGNITITQLGDRYKIQYKNKQGNPEIMLCHERNLEQFILLVERVSESE